MTGPTNVVIDQTPSAVDRLSDGKIEMSSAWLPGIIGPEHAPCRIRNTISEGRSQAMPHRNDDRVNAATAVQKVRTTPNRPSASRSAAPRRRSPRRRR